MRQDTRLEGREPTQMEGRDWPWVLAVRKGLKPSYGASQVS